MERFNVSVLEGYRPGMTTETVRYELEKIKLQKKTVEFILKVKSSAVIKKNITLVEAKKLQRTLNKCGLQTDLELDLNPDCFALGIKKPMPKRQTPSIYIIDENLVHPKIFGVSQKKTLTSNKISENIAVEKIGHTWNPTLLIMATLIIALLLEVYLVNILSAYFGLRSLASIAGVGSLILMAFALHPLLQPLLCFEVEKNNSKQLLLEDFSWHLLQKNYTVYDQNNAPTAIIHKQKDHAELYNANGDPLFKWDRSLQFKELDDQKIEGIQYDFVMDNVSEVFDNYLSLIENILDIFKKKIEINKEAWRTQDGTGIINQDNTLVAVVFFKPCPALKILTNNIDKSQSATLLFFTLAILRSHYG